MLDPLGLLFLCVSDTLTSTTPHLPRAPRNTIPTLLKLNDFAHDADGACSWTDVWSSKIVLLPMLITRCPEESLPYQPVSALDRWIFSRYWVIYFSPVTPTPIHRTHRAIVGLDDFRYENEYGTHNSFNSRPHSTSLSLAMKKWANNLGSASSSKRTLEPIQWPLTSTLLVSTPILILIYLTRHQLSI